MDTIKTKITNLTSLRGNRLPNQFKIQTENALYFQSYESLIVKIQNDKVYLDSEFWNFSKTTSKYRNMFLGEKLNDTLRKIDEGIYTLTNLN